MHTTDRQRAGGRTPSLTRRHLVTTSIAGGATLFTFPAMAGASTPEASPVPVTIDPTFLLELSGRLAGGAKLAENAVEPLAALLATEPDIEATLAELRAVEEFTPETLAATSDEAQHVAANILQYWFLGRYDNLPVENRADMFFSLASWQTLPYATQQSLCKSFGYWAQEIEL